MARRIFCFLIVQGLVCKVLSIYAQPTIQQYLHLTGTPHSAQAITLPAQQTAPPPNTGPTNQPRPATGLPSFSALSLPELVSRLQQLPTIQQTAPSPNLVATQARPSTGLSSFSGLALPNLVSGLHQLPAQRPAEIKTSNPSSIDSNLLNNLAIALQLLIVSNILNTPPPADSPAAKSKEIACSEPISSPYYSQSQAVLPNSNFVGSSSFSEPNLAQAYIKPTRNSMCLMSPYEALESKMPYSDPISTSYGSYNPRQDFQSPYSMMADKDLFSMNDLF